MMPPSAHYVLLDLSIPVQSGRGLDSIEYGSRALDDAGDDEKLRQERVLEMIRSGERLRIPKIVERLHCSYSTAKRTADGLKAENRIVFVGPSKTGRYEIVPAGADGRSHDIPIR
ncbi:MAG: hypothetical protein ACYC26_10025 [Phycisphaerales bacterium]